MVRLILRRKKSSKAKDKAKAKGKGKAKSKVLDVCPPSNQDDATSIATFSSEKTHHYVGAVNSVNSSLVAQFAQMSTMIATTLTEEEFGTQENNLYRPNAKYSSRVIHPVECKRDIFVESVTPVKKSKMKRVYKKSTSIYQANVGRPRSPYVDSNDVHDRSERRIVTQKIATGGASIQSLPIAETDRTEECESSSLTYSVDDKENESDQYKVDLGAANTIASRRLSTNTFGKSSENFVNNANNREFGLNSGFRLNKLQSSPKRNLRVETGSQRLKSNLRVETGSRPNNNLRVETGRNPTIENIAMPGMNNGALLQELPRVSRSTNMEISPSSTVSSLTLPAEIDLALHMFTPREVVHPNAMPIITEDDGKFSEI